MKKILITGGTGFVGRHLVKELLFRYPEAEINTLSRSEGPICELLDECTSNRLKVIMADIRDSKAVQEACRGVDTLIHLAAMKRVHLAEVECRETVSINVIGTMNLLEYFSGKTFIQISTDKAVEPVNCYGATKLIAEKLVLEKAAKRGNGARFMIIRCGNIMGSSGSVIEIWQHQIQTTNELTVTHPDMLRYYTNVNEVIKILSAMLEWGTNGKIYIVPDRAPVILQDMVNQALKLYGNERTRIKITGPRSGERMFEKMFCTEEKDIICKPREFLEISKALPETLAKIPV